MRVSLLLLLMLVGVGCVVAGVAMVYPPAALILFGAFCVAVAFVTEVRDT